MNDLIAVQKIAGWAKLKALVLDSVSSPITKRAESPVPKPAKSSNVPFGKKARIRTGIGQREVEKHAIRWPRSAKAEDPTARSGCTLQREELVILPLPPRIEPEQAAAWPLPAP